MMTLEKKNDYKEDFFKGFIAASFVFILTLFIYPFIGEKSQLADTYSGSVVLCNNTLYENKIGELNNQVVGLSKFSNIQTKMLKSVLNHTNSTIDLKFGIFMVSKNGDSPPTGYWVIHNETHIKNFGGGYEQYSEVLSPVMEQKSCHFDIEYGEPLGRAVVNCD